MSYTPTTWQTGDTITADKLNNMENGIEAANEGEILHITVTENGYQDFTFSVPASGAWEALHAGKIPMMEFHTQYGESILIQGFARASRSDNGGYESYYFYNKMRSDAAERVLITLSRFDWLCDRNISFMDIDWLTSFDTTPSYKVLAFNHTDAFLGWDTVEYVVPMGTLVSPLILAACNAAASEKTTLASNFSGDMAYQLHTVLVIIAGYVRNGRGAGFQYDLDETTGQRFCARADSVYSDEPTGKDIESVSFKAKILPTANGYYEISCFAYAENDYSQSGDYSNGVYSGYFSVTAEKIEPTFVPMS